MAGEILYINNQARQHYFAREVITDFSKAIVKWNQEKLTKLLWFDVQLHLVNSKYAKYGRPYVLNSLHDLIFVNTAREVTYGILPKNKPVLLFTLNRNGITSRELILSFEIIENKIISIIQHNGISIDMIFASHH